jgi:hypothetical protein
VLEINTITFSPTQLPFDAHELARQFLARVLPSEGVYFAGVKSKRGSWRDTPHQTIEDLCTYLFEADRNGGDAYFVVASYSSNDSREAKNVQSLRALRFELDYGEEGHAAPGYTDVREALEALEAFCITVGLSDPMVVRSGGGLHVYWPLKEPVPRELWHRYAEGLKTACHKYGLRVGHECTSDAARVLRLPGTTNRKLPNKPRPVTLDPRFLDIGPYDLAQFGMLLDYAPVAYAGKNAGSRKLPPRPAYLGAYEPNEEGFPDHHDIVSIESLLGCGVVKLFTETGDFCEPTWMRLAALFHYIKDGERLFHEYSAQNYPCYDRVTAQAKYDRGVRPTGPPLCAGFRDGTDQKTREICLKCPHLGRIVTPLALGRSDESVPSAETATTGANNGRARGGILWEMAGKVIKPKSYHNTMLAIERLGITGCHDQFHNHKIVSGDLSENLGSELSDAIVRAVREVIVVQFRFDPGRDTTQEVLDRLCERNRFDPVLDYLAGLKWDGRPRLDRWLIDYLGAEDSPLNRAFGRKTLLAAVRRVRQPGCKFDYLLVLEGPQGAYKSTAIRVLAGDDNFSDAAIKWDDPKQQRETMRGVWIHEIAELTGLKKADVEAIKSFLSRQDDSGRGAYDRLPTSQRRHGISIGTINPVGTRAEYLNDPTGARRFWPVKIGTIDLRAIEFNRDQLWAEAAHIEATGETLDLPAGLHAAAKIQQEERRIHDPWMDTLQSVRGERVETIDGPVMRVSSAELLERYLEIKGTQLTSTAAARAKAVMIRLGWVGPKLIRLPLAGSEVKRQVKLGLQVKGYERPVQQDES